MNKILTGVVVVVVLVIVGFSLANKGPAEAGTVKIGFVGPLSGDAAAYGQEPQRIVQYQIEKINAKNGDKGPHFEVVYEDGKCSGNDAVNSFQKLTDIDGIGIIIGGACSSETLGIAPLTKDRNVLVVSALSSNPAIEGASPNVFSTSYTDEVVGTGLAEQMKGNKRIAIISEQNDYNVGVKNVWAREIAKYAEAEVVADEVFAKGASDFRNLLAKVKRANPDAILLNPNVGVTAVNLLKQLAEMKDWKGYKLYSQIAYLSDDSRAGTGDFANGMVVVDAPDLLNPTFLAFKKDVETAKGSLASIGNYYTASTADTVTILTDLITELGSDPKTVRDALATRTFNGFLGSIHFDGHSYAQGSKSGVYIVENGKAVYQTE